MKNTLKNIQGENYSLICVFVFFVHAKKRKQKIENRKKRKVPTMQCKCTGLTKYANVSAHIPIYTNVVIPGAYPNLVRPPMFVRNLFVKNKKIKSLKLP